VLHLKQMDEISRRLRRQARIRHGPAVRSLGGGEIAIEAR
jgi:hypothetical protein